MPTMFTNEEKEWMNGSYFKSFIETLIENYKK
jgi:hypothetical protein